MKVEQGAGAASEHALAAAPSVRRTVALRRAAAALGAALALATSSGAFAQPSTAQPTTAQPSAAQPSAAQPSAGSQPSDAPSSAASRATSQTNPGSSQSTTPAKNRVVTIREVTIVGRIQKPVAAVDVSRIQPKMTLAELRQPFLQRIGESIYSSPF